MPELAGPEKVLREGLRALSRSCPREAPPWVQDRVLATFRRQHTAQRRRRVFSLAAMAAALILVSSLMLVREHPLSSSGAGLAVADSAAAETKSPNSVSQPFIPVLYGQRPAVGGPAIVVRLEMPASDLRLVGIPVDEEVANRTVQAEVAVGPDGLPYALRLLPDNNFNNDQGVKP